MAVDGRQSRTQRSRRAICEACLDLVQEGVLQPSADEIAARAGLSRRSIFNHFADLAELYDAVVEVGMQRCAPLLKKISDRKPLAERLASYTEVRSAFLEATAPFTRALTAQALVGPAGEQARRVSREALAPQQREVERLFGAELAEQTAAERRETLEALYAATSPLTWESLRRGRGLSMNRARDVMHRTMVALLRAAGVEPAEA